MIKTYHDRIVCRRLGDDMKTDKGVVRPSSRKEKPLLVEVIASGVSDVKTGHKYCISRYSGVEVEFEGELLVVITPKDILFEIAEEEK